MKLDWKKLFGLSVLLLCGAAYPIVGTAGLYKWTDEQGNLHITDVPPPAAEESAGLAAEPAPSSSQPLSKKKTSMNPLSPAGRKQAGVPPVPSSMVSPQPLNKNEQGAQSSVVGLRPEQATAASPWEVFDEKRGNAKAGVQRWKDEAGIEHFVDVLPDARRHPGSP